MGMAAILVMWPVTEVLSDPKIAGQLRKNSSGHATRFLKKNHEILKFLQLWPKICECVRNHSIVTYVSEICECVRNHSIVTYIL